MNHHKPIAICAAFALIGVLHASGASAEIKSQIVEYRQGDTVLEGFLAYDDAVQGKRPAILVAHTWTGVSDFIRTRSTELGRFTASTRPTKKHSRSDGSLIVHSSSS